MSSILAVAGAATLFAPPAQAVVLPASTPTVGFGGYALGSQAWNNDRTIMHGPHAWATLNCVAEVGIEKTANSATSDLGEVGSAGVTDSSVSTVEEDGWSKNAATTETASASLLNGLVEAKGIVTTSVAATDGEEFVGTHETKIASLEIAGQAVDVEVGPNTTIDLALPGVGSIGKVVLNKQNTVERNGEFTVHTEALHVSIAEDNPLDLQIGTHARVAAANARITEPRAAYLAGMGYATKASVGEKLLDHGPTAFAPMPCAGGQAQNRIASAELPGVISAAGAETTAVGDLDNGATSQVTQTIGEVDLFDGAITADAVTAKATASRGLGPMASLLGAENTTSPMQTQLSDEGTRFVNLSIHGKPVADIDLGPNSTIDVAGIGTITLRKTERSSNQIKITMLEVELGQPREGLAAGAIVEVGHARASVR